MANREHLTILQKALDGDDISIWNNWRKENPYKSPDLSNARLEGANLRFANFNRSNLQGIYLPEANLIEATFSVANMSNANLIGSNLENAKLMGSFLREADLLAANLSNANLVGADLRDVRLAKANLTQANLSEANLNGADLGSVILKDATLCEAILSDVNLYGANMSRANLSEAHMTRTELYGANLSGANLTDTIIRGSHFIETNFSNAILDGCAVYGVSAWDINLEGAIQTNLNISPNGQAPITVDNLKVAQFIYLLLNNAEIRNVIDTITAKAVLILGRFAPERKVILDAIRDELRNRGYLPILFDFEKPTSRDLTETVVTLAHLSRFVIADLTNPSSIPHELMSFTRDLPSVPVQPIILKGQRPYAMFLDHLGRYQHVLEVHEYESQDTLIAELSDKVIQPAQDKAEEMKSKPF